MLSASSEQYGPLFRAKWSKWSEYATAPIFNAGRIRAYIRVTWAEYDKTVLMAFPDVGAALVSYGKLKERHESLTAPQALARDRVQIQEFRYLRGTADYLGLLDARRNLVLSVIGLTESSRSLAEASLAVYSSLGGTWIQEGSELDLKAPWVFVNIRPKHIHW